MQSERIEEYLETILYLINKNKGPAKTKKIADELKVSAPSVTEMVQKLAAEGLVKYTPYYGVELTEAGAIKASKIRRKHQVLEKFLADVLGVNKTDAHKEACELEHAVSDTVLEQVCTFMGHPEICPDGNPIGQGKCCTTVEEQYPVLSEMQEGSCGIVSMIKLPPADKDRLISLGLMVGESLVVKRKQHKGSISVLTRGTEIALGNEIASKIFVKPQRMIRGRVRRRGRH
ncbi:MAG: metal-dependent transcriptional regulator [Methanosarcinaceae archaeon]|nr:metal-dependent transcriptional regulator [Methanosarcinaceae archaeon]